MLKNVLSNTVWTKNRIVYSRQFMEIFQNYTVLHIMYSNIFPDDVVLSCSVLTFIFKIESIEEYVPGIFYSLSVE